MARFQERSERVRQRSPYGRRPGWALRPVMVKSGDDCRQEALAMQLISAFDTLFQVRTTLRPAGWRQAAVPQSKMCRPPLVCDCVDRALSCLGKHHSK